MTLAATNHFICPEGFMTQSPLNLQSIFSRRSDLFHCISFNMKKNHTEIGKQRGIYTFNFVLGRTAEKLSIFQKTFFNVSQKCIY